MIVFLLDQGLIVDHGKNLACWFLLGQQSCWSVNGTNCNNGTWGGLWFGIPTAQLVYSRVWVVVLICFQPEWMAQLSLWELNVHLCHSICSSLLDQRIYLSKYVVCLENKLATLYLPPEVSCLWWHFLICSSSLLLVRYQNGHFILYLLP